MTDADRVTVERLYAKDEMELNLGNTLDVKASLVLVLITFLAAQTEDLLSKGELSHPGRVLQMIAAISLGMALLTAVWGLWIREYAVELPEDLSAWIERLREFYQDELNAELEIERSILGWQIGRTTERIQINGGLNAQRTSLASWSFRLTAAACSKNNA